MKKLILLACFGLFWITGSFAQELDFTLKTDTVSTNSLLKCNITIEINSIEPWVSIYLYDKEPWENGKILKKIEKIKERKYFIPNLDLINYYVCIISENKKMVGKWVEKSNY